MALTYSLALKIDRLSAANARIGANGIVSLYAGTRPASPDVVPGTQPLATCEAASTFASTPTTAVLTANPISQGVGTEHATASGTVATWGRISNSTGVGVIDFEVGPGKDFVMTPDAVIKTDQPVLIEQIKITAGN